MTLRMLAALLALTAVARTTTINFNCPEGWKTDVYRCYQFFNKTLEFPDANEYCQIYGAKLASPGDYQEQTFIGNNVVPGRQDTKYWIGLTREQSAPTNDAANQEAKWTKDLSVSVKMNEIGFWAPLQPTYSPSYVYTYVERVLDTWSPYKFRMYLVPKWTVMPGFVCQRQACLDSQLLCNNGQCANGTLCDGKDDCGDFSDETNCTNARTVDGYTYKTEVLISPGTIQISGSSYSNKLNQQWLLQADVQSRVKLTISSMNLELNVDWLRVWSGAITLDQSDFVAALTGTAGSGNTYYSYNNFMLIQFDTDADTAASGFSATWQAESLTAIYTSSTSTFSPSTLVLAAGAVTTGIRRSWSIQTGDALNIITLKLDKLSAPATASQFVWILDGADGSGMELVPKWSDYTKTDYVMSISNAMFVHVSSNFNIPEAAISFSYWTGCTIVLNQDSGVVASPGKLIGQMYPNNLNCNFTVTATNSSTQLQLTDEGGISLAATTDTLKIWLNSSDTTGSPAYTATTSSSGSVSPSTIQGASMLIQFQSDAANTASGFKLVFGKACTLALNTPITKDIGQTDTQTCTNQVFGQEQYNGANSVTLYCQYDGWRLSDSTGAYATQTPSCINTPCGTAPTVDNGYIRSQNDSMVTYECYPGYGISNSPLSCNNGVWGNTPSCAAATCSAPSTTAQLTYLHTPANETTNNVANVIRYNCSAGYEMKTNPPWSRCNSTGSGNVWAPAAPTCETVKCLPPVVPHATLNPTNAYFNAPSDTLRVKCQSGFTPTEEVTLTCQANGTWSGSIPTCTNINECNGTNPCTAPNTCTDTEGSYTCTCVEGFVLKDDGSGCDNINECNDIGRACQPRTGATCTDRTPDATNPAPFDCTCGSGYFFNATTYLCDKKNCSLPAASTNLTVLGNTDILYLEGDKIFVHCKLGFSPITLTEVTCNNGNFTVLPTCAVATCSVPQASTTAGIAPTSLAPTANSNVEYDQTLNITCGTTVIRRKCIYDVASQTYKLNIPDLTLDSRVTCPVITCEGGASPRLPSGVHRTGSEGDGPFYNSSGSIQVGCAAAGYTMAGLTGTGAAPSSNSVTLKCVNGLWDVNTTVCTGTLCNDPGFPANGTQVVPAATGYSAGSTLTFTCPEGFGYRPTAGGNAVVNFTKTCAQSGNAYSFGVLTDYSGCVDITTPVLQNCNSTAPTTYTIDKYTSFASNSSLQWMSATDNVGIKTVTLSPVWASDSAIYTANQVITYSVGDYASTANSASCTVSINVRGLADATLTVTDPANMKVSLPGDTALNVETASTSITNNIGHSGSTLTFSPNLTSLFTGLNSSSLNTQITTLAIATDSNGNVKNQTVVIKVTTDACGNNSLLLGDGIMVSSFSGNTATLKCINSSSTVLASPATTGPSEIMISCSNGLWVMDATNYFFAPGAATPAGSQTAAVGAPPSCVAPVTPFLETQKIVNISSASTPNQYCLDSLKTGMFQSNINTEVAVLQRTSDTVNPNDVIISAVVTNVTASGNIVTVDFKYIMKPTATGDYSDLMAISGFAEQLRDPNEVGTFPMTPSNCPLLMAVMNQAASTTDVCEPGYYRINDTAHKCLPCPAGSYVSEGVCTACPQGNYSSALSATACQACPNNQTTFGVGSTRVEQCIDKCIQSGLKSAAADGLWPCSACEVGMKPDPANPNVCIPCTATDGPPCPGAPCQAGEYSLDNSGKAPCLKCPQNFYQASTGQSACTSCPSNLPYTANTGSNATSACIAIPSNCASTSCGGQGTCNIAFGNIYCTCNPGYTGVNCGTRIDYCDPNPCFYDATCRAKDTTPFYECVCQTGYGGTNCGTPPNRCDNVNCGSGKCKSNLNGYECICPTGFTGPNCATPADPCANNKCEQGSCAGVGTSWYTCNCQPGYSGDLCQTNIDECASSPCGWGGNCTDQVNGYSCSCLDGSSGSSCSEPSLTCRTNPCANTGQCLFDTLALRADAQQLDNGTFCVCNQYLAPNTTATITVSSTTTSVTYASKNSVCMTADQCTSSYCGSHGTCYSAANGAPLCNCSSGWEGPTCQYDINECAISGFCGNSTGCSNTEGAFTCTCAQGYTTNSTTNKCTVESFCPNEAYCGPNGTCVAYQTCNCTAGFTGQPCVDIDECASNPCLYGGNCTNLVNKYNCTCPAGFTGERCENIPSDPCTATSCSGQGSCVQYNDRAYCKCNVGYFGDNCSQAVDLCVASPCLNNGTCSSNGTAVFCTCGEGTAGQYCQYTQDPCQRCVVGSCVPVMDNSSCSCYGDFSGAYCNVSTDNCAGNPCGSGTLCIDGNAEYFCDCASILKTGQSCSKDKEYNYNLYFTSTSGRAASPYPFTFGGDNFTLHLAVSFVDSTGHFITLYGMDIQYDIARSRELLRVNNTHVILSFGSGPPRELAFQATLAGSVTTERFITIKYTGSTSTLKMFVNLNPDASITDYPLDAGASLPAFGRLVLGSASGATGFRGWVSQVFVWNNVSTVPDDAYDIAASIQQYTTGLVSTWFDYTLESDCYIGQRVSSSTGVAAVPPAITCITDETADLAVRAPGVAVSWSSKVTSTGDLTAIYAADYLYGWGVYSNAITACTNGLCSICTYKIYVQKTPACMNVAYGGVPSDWTCSGTTCTPACSSPKVIQTEAPAYYTCNKDGSYNVENNYVNLFLPGCVDVMPVTTTLNIQVTYVNVTNCAVRISAGQESSYVTSAKTSVTANCNSCSNTMVSQECRSQTTTRQTSGLQTLVVGVNATTTDTQAALGSVDAIAAGIEGPSTASGVTSSIVSSCPAGSALNPDGATCTQCLAGYFQNSDGECEPCPLNNYVATAGQTKCTACPDNKVTLSIGSKSEADCKVSCPVGQMYSASTNACANCEMGYYQNMTGQSFCISCGADQTSHPGSTNYTDCVVACPAGMGTDRETPAHCVNCTVGYYRTATSSSLNCTQCPNNKTTSAPGATAESACITNCSAGSRYNSSTSSCEVCLLGQYQPSSGQLTCLNCTSPLTTSSTGATNVSQCQSVCPAGQYTNATNATQCVPCEQGTYKVASGVMTCTPCAAAFTTNGTGATLASNCTAITYNFTYVTILDLDYTSTSSNFAALQNMMIAHLNSSLANRLLNMTFSFAPGSVQASGSVAVSGQTQEQVQAAMNSYQNTVSATVIDNPTSLECSGGNYLDTAANPLVCAACPMNTYQQTGSINVCTNCQNGYVTRQTMSVGADSCVFECQPGTHVMGSMCVNCSVNTYQPGVNQTTCINCADGYVTDGPGKKEASDCMALVNECANTATNNCTPSANHGICTDLPIGFNCSCEPSYIGSGVGVDGCKHICDTNYCQNGGTCVRSSPTATCMCTSRWQGTTCTEQKNQSSSEWKIIGGVIGGVCGILLLMILGLLCAKCCCKDPTKEPKASRAMSTAQPQQQGRYVYPPYGVTNPLNPVLASNVPRPAMYIPSEGMYSAQAPQDISSRPGYSNYSTGQNTYATAQPLKDGSQFLFFDEMQGQM